MTEHRRWSAARAARVIGLRPEQVSALPADGAFRLEPLALAEAARRDRAAGRLPWAVVANAGATNTGTIDPLAGLADVCAEEKLWLHVDAAYGWPAVLTGEGRGGLARVRRGGRAAPDAAKGVGETVQAEL